MSSPAHAVVPRYVEIDYQHNDYFMISGTPSYDPAFTEHFSTATMTLRFEINAMGGIVSLDHDALQPECADVGRLRLH